LLDVKVAIHLAEQALVHDGIELDRYFPPRAFYEFTARDRTWSVFFVGKSGALGDHYLVVVNDKTSGTEVVPGE